MKQRRWIWALLLAFSLGAAVLLFQLPSSRDVPHSLPRATEAQSEIAPLVAPAAPTIAAAILAPQPSPAAPTPEPPKTSKSAGTEESDLLSEKKLASRSDTLFDALLKPFAAEAQKRRDERARQDAGYYKRIDKPLNEGRVNFLLFGYGETHEPPATEIAIIGSYTLVSYDTRAGVVDMVSFTHDIRAPEIENVVYKDGKGRRAIRMDQAYNAGGFKLMRQVLEDATGLSVDFQVAFKDVVIARLVDDVFAGVGINNPAEFKVHPFYLDGKKYPRATFAAGRLKLNGAQVIQFIKTVPVSEGYYGRTLEHNYRKHQILRALLDTLSTQSADRGFWLRGSGFVAAESVKGAIAYDFDPITLAVSHVTSTVSEIGRYVARGTRGGLGLPEIQRTIYVVDTAHGDGGVRWVSSDAHYGNPIAQQDIKTGVYNTLDYEVPINGNPYSDLVTDYWQSVRTLVKDALMRIERYQPRDWMLAPQIQP